MTIPRGNDYQSGRALGQARSPATWTRRELGQPPGDTGEQQQQQQQQPLNPLPWPSGQECSLRDDNVERLCMQT